MKTTDFMRTFIFSILILSIISCNSSENSNNNPISTAATTVSYTYTPEVKIKTSEKIEGTWETFSSGTKTKWKFQGEKLYKSTIYSFGEVGEPQVLEVYFKDKCQGKSDIYGKSFTLSTNETDEKRQICYTITNISEEQFILNSEHGQKIKFVKRN